MFQKHLFVLLSICVIGDPVWDVSASSLWKRFLLLLHLPNYIDCSAHAPPLGGEGVDKSPENVSCSDFLHDFLSLCSVFVWPLRGGRGEVKRTAGMWYYIMSGHLNNFWNLKKSLQFGNYHLTQQFHSWVYIQKILNANLERYVHPNVRSSTI